MIYFFIFYNLFIQRESKKHYKNNQPLLWDGLLIQYAPKVKFLAKSGITGTSSFRGSGCKYLSKKISLHHFLPPTSILRLI